MEDTRLLRKDPGDPEIVGDICARVDRNGVSDHIVECIYAEVPGYREGSIPRQEVWDSVRENVEMILDGLPAGRPPNAEEIAVRRELGQARAAQGLPVDALVGAYHVGYREIWTALSAQVHDQPPPVLRALLGTATVLWRWVHEITTAVTDAYAEAIRARDLEVLRINQRFAEHLALGDYDSDELIELTGALGFEPHGAFQAIVIDLDPVHPAGLDRAQASLRALPGPARLMLRPKNTAVLWQRMPARVVVAAVKDVTHGLRVGVGLARQGLAGAHLTLGDAERAYLVATSSHPVVDFADSWHSALIAHNVDRLEPLLSVGQDAAGSHPHLAEAVMAFADSGFSVAVAARAVSLHANTVIYRLDRWKTLTGWDPRSFAGLAKSVAAISIAPKT